MTWRYSFIHKPTRLGGSGLQAIIPLRGICEIRDERGHDPMSICAGRGILLADSATIELMPNARTSMVALHCLFDEGDQDFIFQGHARLRTIFTTFDYVLEAATELASREVTKEPLLDYLAAAYGRHGEALSRLPGDYDRSLSVYRRLLDVRAQLEAMPGFSIEQISSAAHVSRSHFFQLFRAAFGITPKAHLILARMIRAMNLLAWSTAPVGEVAILCGYNDRTAFARAFASVATKAASEFRHSIREGKSGFRDFFEAMYEIFRCKINNQFASEIRTSGNTSLNNC